MAFNMRYIWFLITAAVIGLWLMPAFVPVFTGINWMFLLVLGAGITLIIAYFVKSLQLPGLKKTYILPVGAVLIAVFLLGTGTLSTIIPTAAFGPGVLTPVPTTPTGPSIAQLSACQASVSPSLLGKSATLYINAYDQEANQPYASVVDVDWYLTENGAVQPYTDSSAATAGGFSVGDVVSAYGGNGSYYMNPMENICINAQSYAMDLKVNAIVNTTNGLKTTGYDSTSAATLSAGTNLSQEKYDITLGSDQESVFYLKLQINSTNNAFKLSGLATLAANDIDDVAPVSGQGFTKVVVPKFMELPIIAYALNETKNSIVTYTENFTAGYDDLWILANPITLHEWDEVKYKFVIEAGSTDPTNNEDPSSSDVAIICFLDGSWARAGDGTIKFGVYQQDDNEANIGINEYIYKPLAYSTLCTVIEGI